MSARFNLTKDGNKLSVDIEGTGQELITLLVAAMDSNADIEDMVKKATLFYIMREIDKETSADDDSKLAEALKNVTKFEA